MVGLQRSGHSGIGSGRINATRGRVVSNRANRRVCSHSCPGTGLGFGVADVGPRNEQLFPGAEQLKLDDLEMQSRL